MDFRHCDHRRVRALPALADPASTNQASHKIPYVPTLPWVVAIVANIIGQILVGILSSKGSTKKDQRDLEIYKYGEYIGQSFVVLGAVIGLVFSMLRMDHC